MEKRYININNFVKSFLEYHSNEKLLFSNLRIFYELAIFNVKHIFDYCENNCQEIDWNRITRLTFDERKNLVNIFFKRIGVDFNINDIIEEKIFIYEKVEYINCLEKCDDRFLLYGFNGYNKHTGKKEIKVLDTGFITDVIVWVHEISHYLNQPDYSRGEVNDLFTECLAFTCELLFTDYLSEIGYVYESNIMKYMILTTFFSFSCKCYVFSKIYLLFQTISDTSKESYRKVYTYDYDYDKLREKFEDEIFKDQDAIFNALYYTLAAPLSIYMYEEYKKDNNFINNIKRLNDGINDKTVLECLNIIGLTNYDEDSLNKIKLSFESYIEELEEYKVTMDKTKKELIKSKGNIK